MIYYNIEYHNIYKINLNIKPAHSCRTISWCRMKGRRVSWLSLFLYFSVGFEIKPPPRYHCRPYIHWNQQVQTKMLNCYDFVLGVAQVVYCVFMNKRECILKLLTKEKLPFTRYVNIYKWKLLHLHWVISVHQTQHKSSSESLKKRYNSLLIYLILYINY